MTWLAPSGFDPGAELRAECQALGIALVHGEVAAVRAVGKHLLGLQLDDGRDLSCDAVYHRPPCACRR